MSTDASPEVTGSPHTDESATAAVTPRPYGIERPATLWQRVLPSMVSVMAAALPVWWVASRVLTGSDGLLTFSILFWVTVPAIIGLLGLAWLIRARALIVHPRAAGPWTAALYVPFVLAALAWPYFFGEFSIWRLSTESVIASWFDITEASSRAIGVVIVRVTIALGVATLVAAIIEWRSVLTEFNSPGSR